MRSASIHCTVNISSDSVDILISCLWQAFDALVLFWKSMQIWLLVSLLLRTKNWVVSESSQWLLKSNQNSKQRQQLLKRKLTRENLKSDFLLLFVFPFRLNVTSWIQADIRRLILCEISVWNRLEIYVRCKINQNSERLK